MAGRPRRSGVACTFCGSGETAKAGFSRWEGKEKQRYFCHACKRYFRENPKYIKGRGRRERRVSNPPSASRLVLQLHSIEQKLNRTPKLADIRELARQGKAFSVDTYREVFGTYTEALSRARLDAEHTRVYPRGQMIKELRALHKKLGRPLRQRDVESAAKKGKGPSLYFIRREFGSMTAALRAAGAARQKFTDQEIIDLLRRLDAKLGHRVRGSDLAALYREGKAPTAKTIRNRFGSLPTALKLAGVDRKPKPIEKKTLQKPVEKFTRGQMIAQLKLLGERLGKMPSKKDLRRVGRDFCPCDSTYTKVFGSFTRALAAAGFTEDPEHRRVWTNDKIIAALLKLEKELGYFPRRRDIRLLSRKGLAPGASTIERRLGTLTQIKNRLRAGK